MIYEQRIPLTRPAPRGFVTFLIAALAMLSGLPAGAAASLANLRCEYLADPLGIDVAKPRLSWGIESTHRRERQTAYRVLVASTSELLAQDQGDLWDSGKVASDQSIQVEYAGKALTSRTRCHWKVRVWLTRRSPGGASSPGEGGDKGGQASAWSRPALWTMGLLDRSDWSAQWIGFDSDEGLNDWQAMSKLPWYLQRTRLPARMLRREFLVARKVKRATIYACGLGFFELYLNGRQVGDRMMDPALSGPARRVFYVTFDVTQQLARGPNAVGALLGNGRFFPLRAGGHINFGYPKLLLQMQVDYADGTSELITSDERWKLTTQGPIRANNEYDGEEYDARMAMDGWAAPGFDDSAWRPAQRVKSPGELQAQMMEPMRAVERIRPVSVTRGKAGAYIVDFGRVLYGNCRLKVSGKAGTKLQLRSAYSLKPDGTLKMEPNRSALCTDIYILRGRGTETWNPHFKGQGFRLVEVTGFPGVPTADNFEGLIINTDLAPVGSFTCSNPLLNRIFDNVRRTQQLFMRSVPMDPDRDERQGWLGDPAKHSESDAWNFGVAPFYAKWLGDIRLEQGANGDYYGNSPLYFAGDYSAELVWESVTPIVADWFYNFYGDRRIVADNFASADKWMRLMNRHLKPDFTIDRNEYGDWCDASTMDKSGESTDVDGNRRRYEFGATSGPLIATAYHYNNCRIMARLAGILGKVSEQQKYEELAAKVKTGFNGRFFDPKTCQYWSDTQCADVLSLAFGLAPEENRERVIANLVADILVKHQGHLSVGLIGMQWLMQSLTDIGHPEVAYTIATQTTRPSWGYMISKGATTVWEKWDMDTQGPDMNSEALLILSGNLEAWFYQALAGINFDPAQPGFKHIIIKPLLVGDLTYVKASHQSLHGLIASQWRKRGDRLTLAVTIPANTSATLFVPSKDAVTVTESGQPAAQARGVTFLRAEANAAVYAVGSGTYRFESALPAIVKSDTKRESQ